MSKDEHSNVWDFTSPKSLDFPRLEQKILTFWQENNTFQKVLSKNTHHPYTFYDGPPFANGLPHYGHLATGYAKDIIPRYQTMRGHCVPRRFGWDCHGLPAELETEKTLGLSGRQDILAKGIDVFNDHCRRSILRYTKEWEAYVLRQGRWVEFKGAYKTMDCSYMESVLYAFKKLYEKGLIYQGYRVVPYSWKVQTALSHFETRLDQSYRSRQDPAIVVAFPLEGCAESLWVWTTTPWTLPANLALALRSELFYVTVVEKKTGARGIIAQTALARFNKKNNLEVVGTQMGKTLIGKKYRPPFDFFHGHKNGFQVLDGDFVTEEDGTGIVHLAPAFGEDDMTCCQKHDIALVMPVDEAGCFTEDVPPWQGMQVFEANKPIIRALKDLGLLIHNATIDHPYPHCWRTDTPLIYKAVHSWYVRVSALRERMCQLNDEITWVPSHIKDGLFGKWLAHARDWNVSRSRFWGTPIPVWTSNNPAYPRIDVYGSLKELERDFGVALDDLHRPEIDQLTRPNPDDPTGKSIMKRVEDVFDCWFESGAMPFASLHYPFENKEALEHHLPADFIVEYTAQTRGWFYTLMVLATALFDKPPFKNCICHGVVLDGKKQKLSKRLKNYADPQDVFKQYGSDTLRWRMASSPLFVGGNLHLERDGRDLKDVQKRVLRPLWSACHFYSIYASSENITPQWQTDAKTSLNRYLFWQLKLLEKTVRQSLDAYCIPEACSGVERFLDVLNNWYIRRQRDVFWQSKYNDHKQEAYDTLYTTLVVVSRLVAPLLPFLAEALHVSLTNRSVHLEPWPDVSAFPQEREDDHHMNTVREMCSVLLNMRERAKVRIRQPLRKVTIVGDASETLEALKHHIQEEINVKNVTFSFLEDHEHFQHKIWLNPQLRHEHPDWARRADDGDLSLFEKVCPVAPEGIKRQLLLKKTQSPHLVSGVCGHLGLLLDTKITDSLRIEGDRNDLNRHLQVERKARGFNVSDKVFVNVECSDPQRLEAVKKHHGKWLEQSVRIEDWDAPRILKRHGVMGNTTITIFMDVGHNFIKNSPEMTKETAQTMRAFYEKKAQQGYLLAQNNLKMLKDKNL